MIPGMNPREMQKAMKRMGIKQEEIDATEVIIKTTGNTLLIKNPQVSKVNMMGQVTYQIVGEVEELEEVPEISEDDVNTVMEQAQCSKEEAEQVLEETSGNIAEAIVKLQS